jgi:hypothetical protein
MADKEKTSVGERLNLLERNLRALTEWANSVSARFNALNHMMGELMQHVGQLSYDIHMAITDFITTAAWANKQAPSPTTTTTTTTK